MSEDGGLRVGDPVTWNAQGVQLFGTTDADGIILSIKDGLAHILWSTDQETWASMSTLRRKRSA